MYRNVSAKRNDGSSRTVAAFLSDPGAAVSRVAAPPGGAAPRAAGRRARSPRSAVRYVADVRSDLSRVDVLRHAPGSVPQRFNTRNVMNTRPNSDEMATRYRCRWDHMPPNPDHHNRHTHPLKHEPTDCRVVSEKVE